MRLAALRAQDGDLDAAVTLTTEALALSDALGTQDDSPLLRIRLSALGAAQGDFGGAAREVEAVLATASRDGGPVLAFAESTRGTLALLEGRMGDAVESGRRAVAWLDDVRSGPDQVDDLVRAALGVALATGAAASDDPTAGLAEARAVLDRALRSAADSGDLPVVAVVVHGAGGPRRRRGRPGPGRPLAGHGHRGPRPWRRG